MGGNGCEAYNERVHGWMEGLLLWENLGKLQGYLGEREEYVDTFFQTGVFFLFFYFFLKKKKKKGT